MINKNIKKYLYMHYTTKKIETSLKILVNQMGSSRLLNNVKDILLFYQKIVISTAQTWF